jgi:hypothetical protein
MEPGKAAAKAAFPYVRNHHICLNPQRINSGTSFAARAWFTVQRTEQRMTKFRLLGAAALVLSSALASPVMAQEVIYNPGYCAQFYPNANCQNKGPGNPYTGDYQRRTVYQDSYNRWDRHDSGFWPGDVAAGVVGGAIGTAGAIATSPFRGDSYAYSGRYNDSYAARNGFVCQPGAWFKGEDGRRHICQ